MENLFSVLEKNGIVCSTDGYIYGRDAYLTDRRSALCVEPKTEEELLYVLRLLGDKGLPYRIRASGTGYSGSSVPNEGEIQVIVTKLCSSPPREEPNGVFSVSVGTRTEEVHKKLETCDLFYPPDPASFRVSTIGGNIATNAGGPHCYQYGVTSSYIEEVDFYIPKYKKTVKMGSLAPYSTASSLKNVIVGSQGTLGVILAAKIRAIPRPPHSLVWLIQCDSTEQATNMIVESFQQGIMFSAMDMSTSPYIPGVTKNKSATLICSIRGGKNYIDEIAPRIDSLIKKHASSWEKSSVPSELMAKRASLVKKNVSYTIETSGKKCYFLFDAVVPRTRLKDCLDHIYSLGDELNVPIMNTFHAGDGNIHPTIFYNPDSVDDLNKLQVFWFKVLEFTHLNGGALSGEHGSGEEKRDIAVLFEKKETIDQIKKVMSFFDPASNLAAGKLVADEKRGELLDAEIRKSGVRRENKQSSDKLEEEALNGVLSIPADKTVAEIQRSLDETKLVLPITPVINTSCLAFFRDNIPNLSPHLYKGRDLLMGAEICRDGITSVVGKKVLKNVSNYNLVSMLLKTQGNSKVENLYLKAFPLPKEAPYVLLSSSKCGVADYLEGYKKIEKQVMATYYHDGQAFFVAYNDADVIASIDKCVPSMECSAIFTTPYASSRKEALIVSYHDIKSADAICGFSTDFILMPKDNTVVFYDNIENAADVSKKISSQLGDRLVSIRFVGEKGERTIFASDSIRTQDNIESELLKHLEDGNNPVYEDRARISNAPGMLNFLDCSLAERSPTGHADIDAQIIKCSHCGLCMADCSQYAETHAEVCSPRGFIRMLKENKMDAAKAFTERCGDCVKDVPCENLCPTGVSLSKIFSKIAVLKRLANG
ncbi:MAG: FAD-linked oxidase C-terminal domain-containing protein [Alphaproteobacteria bacterium]|nr:FAD-linked oxidase C-terminal domain-containing protein [Alphaproteobacteria bacterium]